MDEGTAVVLGFLVLLLIWLWLLKTVIHQQTLLTETSIPIIRHLYLLALFLSLAVQVTLTVCSLYLDSNSFDDPLFHQFALIIACVLIGFGALITFLQGKRNEMFEEIERREQVPHYSRNMDPSVLFKRPSHLDEPFQGFFFAVLQIGLHFGFAKVKTGWTDLYNPTIGNTMLIISVFLTVLKLRACITANKLSLEYDRRILQNPIPAAVEEEEDLTDYDEKSDDDVTYRYTPNFRFSQSGMLQNNTANWIDPLESKRAYLVRPERPSANLNGGSRLSERNQMGYERCTTNNQDLKRAMNEWSQTAHNTYI